MFGLWDNWSGSDLSRELLDDEYLHSVACEYERNYSRVRYQLQAKISQSELGRFEHDCRVLDHYFCQIRRLMQRWVFDKSINDMKRKNFEKYAIWILLIFAGLSAYDYFFHDKVLATWMDQYINWLALLIVFLWYSIAQSFRSLIYAMYSENNSIKLDRMIDEVANLTGYTITYKLIRMCNDYADSIVEEGNLHLAKAMLATKYVKSSDLDEFGNVTISWYKKCGIIDSDWDSFSSRFDEKS